MLAPSIFSGIKKANKLIVMQKSTNIRAFMKITRGTRKSKIILYSFTAMFYAPDMLDMESDKTTSLRN